MDPQMISVLAGRVALERLTPRQGEMSRVSVGRRRTLVRLARALVPGLVSRRREDSGQPVILQGARETARWEPL
jgi:hypothetical protein